MIGVLIFGPWINKHSPTELLPWVGALPPGSEHPDCLTENRFMVGQRADSSVKVLGGRSIQFIMKDKRSRTFRVALRKGKISRITEMDETIQLDELDLRSSTKVITDVANDEQTERELPKAFLKIGKSPPINFFSQGQRVLFLQIPEPESRSNYQITLSSGIVETIYSNGQFSSQAILAGKSVEKVLVDGSEIVQMHLLGTDDFGRDLLSRTLFGGRISLLVGITATLVSLAIGVIYGSVSGYFGGRTDRVMMGFIDILYAVPFMFLVIILLVFFGRDIIILFVALGAVQWLTMARIIRGQILTLKEMEFVDAAKVCGAGHFRVLFIHLIPNSIGPIITYTALTIPTVILEESFLSFLGLSVQFNGENLESWGALVFQGMQSLGSDGSKSWLLLYPSFAMVSTLLGLNWLGDGLRDYFDPKRRAHF